MKWGSGHKNPFLYNRDVWGAMGCRGAAVQNVSGNEILERSGIPTGAAR